MPRTPVVAVLALVAALPLAAQAPDSVYLRRALRLHHAAVMVDGHNDMLWEIRNRYGSSLDSADLGRGVPGMQTDIPRLRAGGVGAQFWSLWAPTALAQQSGPKFILEQIDLLRRIERRWPTVFLPARSAEDILRAHREHRIASLMGMEGGDYLQNSLPVLRDMYDLGVRYMTLTWNATLPWVDAATDTVQRGGLSPFGREVVREMNRLGMLVDISHVSDSVMAQVLRLSEAPVIFSHSSARALADHKRDVPDAILQMVPHNGGVVMVNFYCFFTDSATLRWSREASAAQAPLRQQYGADTARVRQEMQAWTSAHPQPPRPTVATIADHIDHIARVAGVDHVGYGSDFDGIDCAPQGLEDVGDFPHLTAELLRRGWREGDVEKVMGGNLLRAFRQAEVVAHRLQRTRAPSTATIAMDSVKAGS
jgi:membrane dipeptidase